MDLIGGLIGLMGGPIGLLGGLIGLIGGLISGLIGGLISIRETVPSQTSDMGKKTVSVLAHKFLLP